MLVVINSASLQLIPSTVAALRASLGSAAPYDILPCVWLTTLVSQATGIAAALLLAKIQRNTQAASPLCGVKRSRLPFLRKKSAR